MHEGVIRLADLGNIFSNSVIMYNNKPTYIEQIISDKVIQVRDLLTQRKSNIAFDKEKFFSPLRRLGMVNIDGSVLYTSRLPVRRYKAGLDGNNFIVKELVTKYPKGVAATRARLRQLDCIELGDCLMNSYPSFKECIEHVKVFGGAMAFDKQFAIDYRGYIFYKTEKVGTILLSKTNIKSIIWSEGNEWLSILLGEKNEGLRITA